MRGGRIASLVRTRRFHIVLLVTGALFFLTGAFHGNVWFDESYSVGIANHSFSEIWRIGSGDVHPVLFYWALHVLNLVFGQNILVYRLFACMGAFALAALGYTHIRRDFGRRVGVLFSLFALFTPYISIMAVEIRMYSWATFAVMLCALTAYRIAGNVRLGTACATSAQRRASAGRWIVFFCASLASAYLHYFGVLAAFVINLMLFAYLIYGCVRYRRGKKFLITFLVLAVIQIILYSPWLMVLAGQVGVVSSTYWAKIVFPATFLELASYPILTSKLSFAARGAYGLAAQGLFWATMIATIGVVVASIVWAVRRRFFRPRVLVGEGHAKVSANPMVRPPVLRRVLGQIFSPRNAPITCALGLYLGVFLIALVASEVMNSLILYYRYLFVVIGPFLLACALVIARIESRLIQASFCVLLMCFATINQGLLIADSYSPQNQVSLTYFKEKVSELAAADSEEGKAPLVVSSDIGIEGVTAVTFRDIPQVYMDWQKGNWGQAYEAYNPPLTSKKSWELILDDFQGKFIVLGQSQTGDAPRDVSDLDAKEGFTLLESRTFYRPYERTYFTVAVMEKA